jgi:hypothetical protein
VDVAVDPMATTTNSHRRGSGRADAAGSTVAGSATAAAVEKPSQAQPGSGVGRRLTLTPAEFCFLTLVLRHTRRPCLMAWSLELMAGALDGRLADTVNLSSPPPPALTGNECSGSSCGSGGRGGSGVAGANVDTGRALCTRFWEETDQAIKAATAEAYIARALTTDKPTLLNDPTAIVTGIEVGASGGGDCGGDGGDSGGGRGGNGSVIGSGSGGGGGGVRVASRPRPPMGEDDSSQSIPLQTHVLDTRCLKIAGGKQGGSRHTVTRQCSCFPQPCRPTCHDGRAWQPRQGALVNFRRVTF